MLSYQRQWILFALENGEDIEYIPVVHLFDPRASRRLQY